MVSENPSGADNQQETKSDLPIFHPMWVVGFVDGEGCFSVSVHKNTNASRSFGWQLQPAFQVYQHRSHRQTLDGLVRFFGCGSVRSKGPNSNVDTFSVWAVRDLLSAVVPFFDRHPLEVKAKDFERFRRIVTGLHRQEHWTRDGFERLVRLAFSMNANGKQRTRTIEQILEGSSETARQA